jgi:hypothetical protein
VLDATPEDCNDTQSETGPSFVSRPLQITPGNSQVWEVIEHLGPEVTEQAPSQAVAVHVSDLPFLVNAAINEAYRRDLESFTLSYLSRLVLGRTTRLSAEQMDEFRSLAGADIRVHRNGRKGAFFLEHSDYDPASAHWPYDRANVDFEKVDHLAKQIAVSMPKGKKLSPNMLLGLLDDKEEAQQLTEDEVTEILASLITDFDIHPTQTGKFIRNDTKSPNKKAFTAKDEREHSRRHRFSREEARKIELLTHGKFAQIVSKGGAKKRKRVYNLLTRHPRTVHPEKLLFREL